MALKRISLKCTENLGMHPQKRFASPSIGGWVSLDWYRRDYITVFQAIELGTPGLLSNDGILDSHLQRCCAVCHEYEVQNISVHNMDTPRSCV